MEEIHNTHYHISFREGWTLTPECHYILGQCDAIVRAISDTPIQPDFRRRLLKVALVKGAQATTAIEGNTLSLEDIERIEDGAELPESREYQQKEVENVLNALNEIRSAVLEKNTIRLITPELIREFHEKIGRDIGDAFKAIPGKFRTSNVMVGRYRAPIHAEVPALVDRLCGWMKTQFHFEKGQHFSETVVQAIVTHLYIAWIHPFSDGNGRTARLLEFYLLLRAGVPDIASHVLSNHYNLTRTEYYDRIAEAAKANDAGCFILYALKGFRDGLFEVLATIQDDQTVLSWRNFLTEHYSKNRVVGKAAAANRYRNIIASYLPHDRWLRSEEIRLVSSEVNEVVRKVSDRTFLRYLADLVDAGIAIVSEQGYKANTELLRRFMAGSVLRRKRGEKQ